MNKIYTAEVWCDVIYDDMWSMINRYICERTGIQPTVMLTEPERQTIQNTIDVITDIILDKVETAISPFEKEKPNEKE